VLLVVYVLVYMVTVLYSGSLVFSEITGWSFHFVLALIVVLVGLYTIKGGLTSVMWTDSLQCLLLSARCGALLCRPRPYRRRLASDDRRDPSRYISISRPTTRGLPSWA